MVRKRKRALRDDELSCGCPIRPESEGGTLHCSLCDKCPDHCDHRAMHEERRKLEDEYRRGQDAIQKLDKLGDDLKRLMANLEEQAAWAEERHQPITPRPQGE